MYNSILTSMFIKVFINYYLCSVRSNLVKYIFYYFNYTSYLFITLCDLLKDPFSSFKGLLLPVGWILYQDLCMVSLYKLNKSSSNEIKIIIEKQIVFQSSNLNISYFVNQKRQDSKRLDLKQLTYPLEFKLPILFNYLIINLFVKGAQVS